MVKLSYLLQQFLVTKSNHSKQRLISQSILLIMERYIHTYIRLLTTSPKGLFNANYKEKDKNKNIYELFKVTIANH